MKAATTATTGRGKGQSSMAMVLFLSFFSFFIMVAAKMCSLLVQDAGSKEGRDNGYGEMATAGNDFYREGLGCGCATLTRATSDGGGLRGYTEEEQREMTAGVAGSYSGRGEKEAEEVVVATKVARKRRRQRPTMGGNGG
ncbi:hypothetical protein BHE74_00055180 [Ensete ventricosum]|nr:hypothetical protein BHE74_00055180 [Ensete ventricosum]